MKTWKRHLIDISGASAASLLATAADGAIYIVLLRTLVAAESISVGLAAGLAALVGGVVHFALNRYWVFARFDTSFKQSALSYFAVSWLAALFHGLLTAFWVSVLGQSMGQSGGWAFSKLLIWLLWIYPMTRYVVFGGIAVRKEKE